MTVTLKLLGGLSLDDSDGPLTGQVTQRRRLAFLAVLASGARGGASRDRLMALLWPDLDVEGARHRLSDSLYVARRALGETVVVPMGDDLRLEDTQIRVDVREFERAIDEGRIERAVELYSGPFLDGFHLGGEGEFDRWVEKERARLAQRYVLALRALASAAETRGDFASAAEPLRRLVAIDPLDAQITLQLMHALERTGNGAAALRHARIHQALRNTELGLGEDPVVRAAEISLLARMDNPSPTDKPVLPAGAGSSDAAPLLSESIAIGELGRDEAASIGRSTPPASRRGRTWHRLGIAAAALAVIAGAAFVGRASSAQSTLAAEVAAADAAPGVAVFPFVIHGDSSDFTGDALATLVATELDGGNGMRSIDPNALLARYRPEPEHPDPADAARLARSLGARYFVLGDAMRAAGRLHLGAALYDANDGKPIDELIGVEGESSAFFVLVDSLSSRLLVERRGQPTAQLEHLASLTTNSLPALKLFLDGEALAQTGRYADAAERFERATLADSTFALAYYRLAWARSWIPGHGIDVPTMEIAARYGARLPERIRVTLAALLAIAHGDALRGESLLREVIARNPDDFDANLWLGDLLFHSNPGRGRSAVEARGPLERASILAPARGAEALFHLIDIAAVERRYRDEDSLASLYLVLHHESDLATRVRMELALLRHDRARMTLMRAELARLGTRDALGAIAITLVTARNLDGAFELLAVLDDPRRPTSERASVLLAMANLAGARGAWRAVDSLFDRASVLEPAEAPLVRARLLSLPVLDPPKQAIADAVGALAETHPTSPIEIARTELLRALLAMRLGDNEGARVAAERHAARMPDDYVVRELWLEVAARRLLSVGKPADALALLVAPDNSSPGPPLRYLRGEVLEALHRPREALVWYDVSEQAYGAEAYHAAVAQAHRRLAGH